MSTDIEALGRRAIACKHWRWMPGMEAVREGRVDSRSIDIELWIYDSDIPDLSDPATLGCLLALVREAWGDGWEIAIEVNSHDRRTMGCSLRMLRADGTRHMFGGFTLCEVLVAALEAAP